MKLIVTTVDAATAARRDHVLDLPEDCTVGDLAAAVDPAPAAAGAAQGNGLQQFLSGTAGGARPLYLVGAAVDPARPVRGSGILEGCVLGLGGPAADPGADAGRAAPPPGEPVLAEVHAVSGPGAGRSWQLPCGGYEIGAAPGCAIRVSGPDAPESGVWVTVAADGTAYWHDERPAGQDDGTVRPCDPAGPPDIDPVTGLPPDRSSPEERREIVREEAELAEARRRERERSGGPGDPTGAVRWPHDTDLAVGGTLLRLVAPVVPDAAVAASADGLGLDYNRPPRIAPHLDAEPLRMPTPAGPRPRTPFPLVILIAPVVIGLILAGIMRSYFYLMFLFLTPIMVLSNWISGRRNNKKTHAEARQRYRSRRRVVEGEIRAAAGWERRVRSSTGPDPATVGLIASGPGARLWERRRGDPDHLSLRVGTVDLPSVKAVDDPAQDENHRTIRWTLPDIPIGVEIADLGVVGVAGDAAPVRAVARWCLGQAAVLHSPRDVRAVVLTDGARASEWGWVRWLPHLRPLVPGPLVAVGNDSESVANRVTELVAEIRNRQRAKESASGRAMFAGPDVLVVMDGARKLRDVPGMVRILTEGPAVRVFSLCLDEHERLLPEECRTVLAVAGGTLTIRRTGVPDTTGVRADLVSAAWCERVARSLAPLRDVSPQDDGGLPDESRLLELLRQEPPDARALAERWRTYPASTTFALGVGFDGPLALDLVRDGPHGLVAGTTGSGKSELLRAFVASLAAMNRPDELTFVLIDYKGGSAFRECADLPHTLGMVTDLDGHLVRRALDSLGAELRRRERVLAEQDAKDHAEYRAKRAADTELPPLPRLVLIIDEFATLVREVPDFVTGLIGIAQRGRSLGIHLVLATQRPAGVVTPDIKANTTLRIALRVTDMTESQDIIDTGEAVGISPDTPGRALVRRGPQSSVLFQSAWVGAERGGGAPAPSRGRVRASDLPWNRLGRPPAAAAPDPADAALPPGPPAPTDLQVLVEAVREATELIGDYVPQPSPWLPALPESIVLDELPELGGSGGGLPVIPYALEDIPQLQERRVATVDLAVFGHLYVAGAPRSGRTQVLRTIAGSAARAVGCGDLHIYGIDAGGGGLAALQALPHCGAIASRHDIEQLERLIGRLSAELTRRQEACAAHQCSGLVELRARLPATDRPAHILLLVDGWDALTPVLDEYDGGRLFGEMVRLLREGAAAGVHIVATSERSLLAGRAAAHNDHKLMLRQADRGDYSLLGMLPSQVPAAVPDGRGWHLLSGTETQVALLAADPSGHAQADALREIGAEARRRDARVPAARRPFTVVPLPASIAFTDAYEKVPDELRRPMWGLLGVGGDDAGPLGADFAGPAPSFLVAGPPGSGRSNTLACLAVSLLAGGTSLVVLTPRDSPLRALAAHAGASVLTDSDPGADAVRAALDALPGPGVVLVDDADLIAMGAAEPVLKEVAVSGRERGLGLVAAGPAETLSMGMGGWLSAAKRSRRGLLLAPRNLSDGDLIGGRLSVDAVRSHARPGRAWTSGPAGTAQSVQVPLTTLKT